MGQRIFRTRWLELQRRAQLIPYGMGWIQSEKDGGLVLVWETSWTKISGFYLNTRWFCAWFQFRRFHR